MIQEVVKQIEANETVDVEFTVPRAGVFTTALVHLTNAPTTAEDLVIYFRSALGEMFDTIVYSIDPSVDALTDIPFSTPVALPMNKTDKIIVRYPNTDGNKICVVLKGLDSANF